MAVSITPATTHISIIEKPIFDSEPKRTNLMVPTSHESNPETHTNLIAKKKSSPRRTSGIRKNSENANLNSKTTIKLRKLKKGTKKLNPICDEEKRTLKWVYVF